MRLCLLLSLLACSPAPADTDLSPDTASDPQVPSDLGATCAAGCTEPMCALEEEGCEGGYCLWDGEVRWAYCSMPCDGDCPEGYRCLEADDNTGSYCFTNDPVCGNGAVEWSEVCDDGNTEGGDWCSATCHEHTQPPSYGTITVSFHGGAEIVSTGEDPVVHAVRISERLYFDASSSEATFGMALADDAGPAPFTEVLDVGLIENVGGNLCSYQGTTTASVSTLDVARRHIVGDGGAFTMLCATGNCEFGCTQQFEMTVSFDLHWNEE